MKLLLPIFLITIFCTLNFNAQTQIGIDINGVAANDNLGFSVSLSTNGSIMAIGTPFNGRMYLHEISHPEQSSLRKIVKQ